MSEHMGQTEHKHTDGTCTEWPDITIRTASGKATSRCVTPNRRVLSADHVSIHLTRGATGLHHICV